MRVVSTHGTSSSVRRVRRAPLLTVVEKSRRAPLTGRAVRRAGVAIKFTRTPFAGSLVTAPETPRVRIADADVSETLESVRREREVRPESIGTAVDEYRAALYSDEEEDIDLDDELL